MNVRFSPPQLKAARHSETFCRLLGELSPEDAQVDVRVLQNLAYDPMRVVLVAEGMEPARIALPHSWLYSEISEEEIRERLSELVSRRVRK